MECSNCEFEVDPGMKFALMKNMCPACGAGLFTKQEVSDLAKVRSRVAKQEFADDLDEEDIYDIAYFVFKEMKSGIGQIFLQREIAKLDKGTIEEGDGAEAENSSEEDSDEPFDPDKIREEIRKEAVGESLESDESFEDEETIAEPTEPLNIKRRKRAKKKERPRIRVPDDLFDDDLDDDDFVVSPGGSESVDDKVKRLKRVAKSSGRKTGPMVKRVG